MIGAQLRWVDAWDHRRLLLLSAPLNSLEVAVWGRACQFDERVCSLEVALRPRVRGGYKQQPRLNVESKVSASSAIVFFGEQKRLIPMNLVHTAFLVWKLNKLTMKIVSLKLTLRRMVVNSNWFFFFFLKCNGGPRSFHCTCRDGRKCQILIFVKLFSS